jgi:dephospho-CoA kinase
MIIGITGTNGSGKGAVVDYLEHQKGFKHYSVRDYLERRLREQGMPVDRPHLGQLGDKLRQEHGAGFFTELFTKEMRENGVEDATIESIRSVGEARALKEHGGILLAVDADRKLRYGRIVNRHSGTDDLDFETFASQEENEWRSSLDEGMNVPAVMKMADHTIYNDNDTKALFVAVEDFLTTFKKVD